MRCHTPIATAPHILGNGAPAFRGRVQKQGLVVVSTGPGGLSMIFPVLQDKPQKDVSTKRDGEKDQETMCGGWRWDEGESRSTVATKNASKTQGLLWVKV